LRKINQAGLTLLKKWEDCRTMPYRDIGGVLTVGFGHTGSDIEEGVPWTQAACDEALQIDLQEFYALNEYCSDIVNDNQYSALICLAYNVGLTAVKNSITLKLVNVGKSPDQEWLGFDKVNGQVIQGLINRRKAELELYHAIN
jgi:lysozyme